MLEAGSSLSTERLDKFGSHYHAAFVRGRTILSFVKKKKKPRGIVGS